jgi:HPt (histidine-containing phosphotransfer) domain-containing protein
MVATERSIIVTLLLAVAVHQVSCFTSPLPCTADISRASRVSFSQLNLQQSPLEQNKADDEIERLKSMAQKLRAEASALEAERAQELAAAAEIVFRKFDTNKDGEISLEELKAGLEKALKIELSDKRAEQVMKTFNVSGDGKLQLDEMVGRLLAFVFI